MLPVDIKKSGENQLMIEWDDGHKSLFAIDMLRRKCPCAACKTAREKKASEANPLRVLSPGETLPEDLEIQEAEIVGRYAIQFGWSDGHREGIYSFDYLLSLCQCEQCQSPST